MQQLITSIINAELENARQTLVSHYEGADALARIRCSCCGHVRITTIATVRAGERCQNCNGRKVATSSTTRAPTGPAPHGNTGKASNTMTVEELNRRLEVSGIKLIGKYLNSHTRTRFECECGRMWDALPATVLRSRHCPDCGRRPGGAKKEKVKQ